MDSACCSFAYQRVVVAISEFPCRQCASLGQHSQWFRPVAGFSSLSSANIRSSLMLPGFGASAVVAGLRIDLPWCVVAASESLVEAECCVQPNDEHSCIGRIKAHRIVDDHRVAFGALGAFFPSAPDSFTPRRYVVVVNSARLPKVRWLSGEDQRMRNYVSRIFR